MSLSDRVLHTLNEENAGNPYRQDILNDIKENISILLNSKFDDRITIQGSSLPDMSFLNIDSQELCQLMGKEIYNLIQKYENRINIVAINYDDSLKPWQLTFNIRYTRQNDAFKEFAIKVTFRNNRYCEVL